MSTKTKIAKPAITSKQIGAPAKARVASFTSESPPVASAASIARQAQQA